MAQTTKLWNRNFSLVIRASTMGTIGGIAGSFALAFLVFDETGSTLASALILAIQLLPFLFIPIVIAPIRSASEKDFSGHGGCRQFLFDFRHGTMALVFSLFLHRVSRAVFASGMSRIGRRVGVHQYLSGIDPERRGATGLRGIFHALSGFNGDYDPVCRSAFGHVRCGMDSDCAGRIIASCRYNGELYSFG